MAGVGKQHPRLLWWKPRLSRGRRLARATCRRQSRAGKQVRRRKASPSSTLGCPEPRRSLPRTPAWFSVPATGGRSGPGPGGGRMLSGPSRSKICGCGRVQRPGTQEPAAATAAVGAPTSCRSRPRDTWHRRASTRSARPRIIRAEFRTCLLWPPLLPDLRATVVPIRAGELEPGGRCSRGEPRPRSTGESSSQLRSPNRA